LVVDMLTGSVWTTLSEHLGRATVRRLAVGSLGRGSARLLHTTVGDLVLVDGSRQALENGTTSARAVGRLLRTGARVVSVPGLDTTALLFDIDGRLHVAVGAPAATSDAAESGTGAALLTDGATAVRRLSEQLAVWEASGTVVDEAWVERARDRARRPRRRPAGYAPLRPVEPEPDAETWLGDATAGRLGPWRPLLAEGLGARSWTPPAGVPRPRAGALLILARGPDAPGTGGPGSDGRGSELPLLTSVIASGPDRLLLGATRGTTGPDPRVTDRAAQLLAAADGPLLRLGTEEREPLLAAWGIEDYRRRRRDPLEFYPSMSDRPGTPS
jgi:hypothetical protein